MIYRPTHYQKENFQKLYVITYKALKLFLDGDSLAIRDMSLPPP